jgi:hypothetical protein
MAKQPKGHKKSTETVDRRITKNKALIIEALHKVPIVSRVLKQIGVSRATYYRWHQEDPRFRSQVDDALFHAHEDMNDFTYSKQMELVAEKHPASVRYELEKHHPLYGGRNPYKRDEPPSIGARGKKAIDDVFALFVRTARAIESKYIKKPEPTNGSSTDAIEE